MTPYYERHGITVHHGDCIEVLATIADASVDAVCTDPPYELGFMGRAWDASGIAYNVDLWRECLRVLRPGGHLASFGGTRTYHRMACAIEDAGFEIRDSIHWLYGSGFPKSLDVSKAIDRARDDKPEARAVGAWLGEQRQRAGLSHAQVCAAGGWHGATNHGGASVNWEKGHGVPTWKQWLQLRELIGFGDDMDAEVWRLNGRKGTPGEAWEQREVIGERTTGIGTGHGSTAFIGDSDNRDITAPATPAAERWQGFGTALKPAHEPIVLARRPLSGTVAANVLAHGTGALNIDATRTAGVSAGPGTTPPSSAEGHRSSMAGGALERVGYDGSKGRWPSNVLLSHGGDCDDTACQPGCPVADLDAQSGITTSGNRKAGDHGLMGYMGADVAPMPAIVGDAGGASRFFPSFRWEAKATTAERPQVGGVTHPTVKPLDLMRWLVRLVTPPGGQVLDPFAGSGTTLHAARAEGFRAIGIERHAPYLPLIKARLDARPRQAGPAVAADDEPMDLLDLLGDAS